MAFVSRRVRGRRDFRSVHCTGGCDCYYGTRIFSWECAHACLTPVPGPDVRREELLQWLRPGDARLLRKGSPHDGHFRATQQVRGPHGSLRRTLSSKVPHHALQHQPLPEPRKGRPHHRLEP